MNIVSGIVVYMMIWWTVIFAVLPWGARSPGVSVDGAAPSAPERPNLKIKFMATTIISAVIWAIVAIMIHYKVIDFRQLAADGG